MILPFPKKWKALWKIQEELENIRRAIDEKDPQHFLDEIKHLYPRLEQHGIRMPLINPIQIGDKMYDSTWHDYHLTF